MIARNFMLDNVTYPIQLYQTNSGHAYVDVPDSGAPLNKLMCVPHAGAMLRRSISSAALRLTISLVQHQQA